MLTVYLRVIDIDLDLIYARCNPSTKNINLMEQAEREKKKEEK